jgi:hypothetical protein
MPVAFNSAFGIVFIFDSLGFAVQVQCGYIRSSSTCKPTDCWHHSEKTSEEVKRHLQVNTQDPSRLHPFNYFPRKAKFRGSNMCTFLHFSRPDP